MEFNNIRTIYTWVNTQRQQTTSLKLSLDINSKDLSAVLWCLLRNDIYHYKSKDPKNDSSYELGTDLKFVLNMKKHRSVLLGINYRL